MAASEANKQPVDWELIEKDYRAGIKTLRQVAEDGGVSHTAIMKRAQKGGWSRAIVPKADRSVKVADIGEMYSTPGFVYVVFVHTGLEFFYKIGLASHLDSRLKSHQSSSPFEVRVAIAYFVDNMPLEEKFLHAMFEEKRVRGEWFRLDRQDLELIARRSLLA